jgi:hypothetical protein
LHAINYKNLKLNKQYIKQFEIYKINPKKIKNSVGQPFEVVGNVMVHFLHTPLPLDAREPTRRHMQCPETGGSDLLSSYLPFPADDDALTCKTPKIATSSRF